MTAALEDIATPPGINALDLLLPAVEPEWRTSPDYRRYFTRDDVVLFAYTYLYGHLHNQATGGRVSFAAHHLALAAAAERWPDGRPHRDIMIAPRESAKSTWAIISILWALAHKHRKVALCVGLNGPDIGLHMNTIRAELENNSLLLSDYPHLRPTVRNNASLVESKDGYAIGARGLDAGGSGFKVRDERPGIIWLDDVEDLEGRYSPSEIRLTLGMIRDKILPMNDQAAVLWTGTVTTFGSNLHQVVQGYVGEEKMPDWILDGRWTVHYVPGLQVDARGRERSFWPTRHPLAKLQARKHTYDFALGTQGRPPHPGAGKLWRPDMIRYLDELVPVRNRTIYADVSISGASTKSRHDYMAVYMAGLAEGRMVVEYARTFRGTAADLLACFNDLCEDRPDIHRADVEANQGGEHWRALLHPMPTGVQLTLRYASKEKHARIRGLLRRYERDQIVHAYRLPEYENDLLRYPALEHDDLVDVAAAAADDLLPMAA